MEKSESDFVRLGEFDRPTGLRVRKWLSPTGSRHEYEYIAYYFISRSDEIGTKAKLDEIEGQKWKCVLRYTDFLFVRSRKNQNLVPKHTLSLLPINIVQFGFCTNLVRCRFFSSNKLVERTDRVMTLFEYEWPTATGLTKKNRPSIFTRKNRLWTAYCTSSEEVPEGHRLRD